MLTTAEVAESNAFLQKSMDTNKKIWATRGADARVAAEVKRAAERTTWRQMSGMKLLMHEVGHVGNRPFMIGFGFTGLACMYIQTKFTDEMKANSLYWSTFHGDGKKEGGH
mmetsp:Transcript_10400/g.15780  ORF Transcript_10400/g.15780 Transcript_10400/m.15780 type:complete len:111 (+) Transcript_10400:125-457(+)|eukprot:CAMPEP_0196141254 /NCGR_PEP_ID=MMETSP0910-20130528/9310_1 /TAXON_ID=49265 /ORGANISM="Thalassiosira rotula, Strain GSO102" /LENGTH=110 /DNA_ID=CAMNT_0041402365 /DNA_START=120 /DNA_END=452 /DNA_ORIENTATION=+